MKRVLVFGTGNNFIFCCEEIEKRYDIIGLIDNAEEKWGKEIFGYSIENLEAYEGTLYDKIIITPSNSKEIRQQLLKYRVSSDNILSLEEALKDSGEDHLKMAVLFYGGLGDFLIGRNWLCSLFARYAHDDVRIVLYFNETSMPDAHSVFGDRTDIWELKPIDMTQSRLMERADYDLVIRFAFFPMVWSLCAERLATNNPELFHYVWSLRGYGLLKYNKGFFSSPDFSKTVYELFRDHPDKKYHTLCDLFEDLNISDNYTYELPIGISEKEYLKSIGLSERSYITLDTGLNTEYQKKSNTRAWPWVNWDLLARQIKRRFPQIKVVQVGLKMDNAIEITSDIQLNGQTNGDEIKVLMKNALLHIDYDGGLVHLRHILHGGKSIVLMGPSSVKRHQYPENRYVRTEICPDACEWTTSDWLSVCPKGYRIPICMKSITPEMVMEHISEVLAMEQKSS